MRGICFTRHCLPIALVAAIGLPSAACCPTTSGPTGPAVSYSAQLRPGELRYYDVDIPKGTTQVNLQFSIDSLTVPLRLRQIDPYCLPSPDDSCQSFIDKTTPPRPAGVYSFGDVLPPQGMRTRIVLQNMSADETVTYTVTITPHQAGCT